MPPTPPPPEPPPPVHSYVSTMLGVGTFREEKPPTGGADTHTVTFPVLRASVGAEIGDCRHIRFGLSLDVNAGLKDPEGVFGIESVIDGPLPQEWRLGVRLFAGESTSRDRFTMAGGVRARTPYFAAGVDVVRMGPGLSRDVATGVIGYLGLEGRPAGYTLITELVLAGLITGAVYAVFE